MNGMRNPILTILSILSRHPARSSMGVTMQRLSRDRHIYFLDPDAPPAITIDSGEELLVETWDAFEGLRDAAAFEAKADKGPASGPIYVEGAVPGDALKVELLSIVPKADEGAAHMVMTGRGFLNDDFTRPHCLSIVLDGDEAVLPCGVRLPLRPSMGFVATTPAYRQTTASDSGPYGGDIDLQELVSGSTLYLPVLVPGGLLALGDCHAVVGDGAVAGTGAECASDTLVRVTVQQGADLTGPRALTPEHFIVLSYGEDLGLAMRQATRQMVDFLVQEKGMAPYDAYTLLSLAGDIRISRTFREISSVKMLLPRAVLEQLG
jgi:amidase